MGKIERITLVEQATERLRSRIASGHWRDRLPGIRPLSAELGVSQHTLRAAINLLVDDGLLTGGEAGASYRIRAKAVRSGAAGVRSLKIAMLLRGRFADLPTETRMWHFLVSEALREAGHSPFYVSVPKTKNTSDTGALPRVVRMNPADAWLVPNGSREVLEWFSRSGLPVLAVGGRNHELDIASVNPGMAEPTREIIRRLVALGHRRIVLIIADFSRKPDDSPVTRAFRDELSAAGVRVGDYNIPDWDQTPEGLHALLGSLFKTTPPTALFCWPAPAILGTLTWLEKRGLRVPEDVSFACGGTSLPCEWIRPGLELTGMRAAPEATMRAIVRWAEGLAKGRSSRLKIEIPHAVIQGSSMARARDFSL